MAPLLSSFSDNFGLVLGKIGVPISATGGTVTTAAGKTIHTFTSSGTFEVTLGSRDAEYLVVAGGGGGETIGGGGGAGQFRTASGFPVTPGPYTITVGGGGAGGAGVGYPGGVSGTDSTFGPTIVSSGGGAGGGFNSGGTGTGGGSGGGQGAGGGSGVAAGSGQN